MTIHLSLTERIHREFPHTSTISFLILLHSPSSCLYIPFLHVVCFCLLCSLTFFMCMCVCIYECVCAFMCMFAHARALVCTFVHTYVCACAYVCLHVRLSVYVCVHVCVWVCVSSLWPGEKVMQDDEFTCDLFRFLQLLCEGHNSGVCAGSLVLTVLI